ncbi:MAG TPA: glycoside hydrolase family 18 protein, partial [Panacibacter sp.]|nr:glycoside hydrolase family 18 protein [Panacibacter sp.]
MRKKILFIVSFLLGAVAVINVVSFTAAGKGKPVIIAYVGGYKGLADIDSIDASRISHINYAFVDVKDNRAWLHNEATDTINLRKLVELKQKNPDLKILISVGGWSWSKNFSDATLTDTSTKNFAYSCTAIAARFNLDGIDIDWEYPGMQGDNNVYRPEDKEHYTLLFKYLRESLDSLKKLTHQKYFVTTAVGGSQDYIDHTEMNKVQQYADYINVMSYDYADGSDSISGHHTNLFTSSKDTAQYSADRSIRAFITAGVPAEKIVIGIAFYGKGWQMQSAANNGLYQKALNPARGGGFTYLKDSLINKNGFIRYWDAAAGAPYLFNREKKIFISYD